MSVFLPGQSRLLDLPPELLSEVVANVQRSARLVCRTLRVRFDDICCLLQLHTPRSSAPRLRILNALLQGPPHLSSLDSSRYSFNGTIPMLYACPHQTTLSLSGSRLINKNIRTLAAACPHLTALNLCGSQEINNITPISALTSLRCLDLSHCEYSTLAPLAQCVLLASLTVNSCGFADHSALSTLPSLTWLEVRQHRGYLSLPACPQLTHLDMNCSVLANSQLLSGVTSLLWLDLFFGHIDFTPAALIHCPGLTVLRMRSFFMTDLSPSVACTALTDLKIQSLQHAADLRPLAACTALTSLDLHESSVEMFAALVVCTNLQRLVGVPRLNLHDRDLLRAACGQGLVIDRQNAPPFPDEC